MSAIETRQRAAICAVGAEHRPDPCRSVAVVYERRPEGRAALQSALTLAARAGVGLTVMAVASEERTDVGCGSCRQGASFRNEIACECATEDLLEARDLVASEHTEVAVQYVLARGWFTRAVLSSADEHGAGVIVLPARRGGRLRRRLSVDRARRLRKRSAAAVVVAPDRFPGVSA